MRKNDVLQAAGYKTGSTKRIAWSSKEYRATATHSMYGKFREVRTRILRHATGQKYRLTETDRPTHIAILHTPSSVEVKRY